MIQLTVERFKDICPKENFWVVTSERYVDIVKEQLPQIPAQHILAEPEARNTAPCIAYACWKIRKEFPQANIVVTPSDALVIDTAEFARCIAVALERTADSQAIVTLGMKPTRPETGYGYIAAQGEAERKGICKVEAFKEKPDVETAKGYLAAGNYFVERGDFCVERGHDYECHTQVCAADCRSDGRAGACLVYGQRDGGAEAALPYLREDFHRLCGDGEGGGYLCAAGGVRME